MKMKILKYENSQFSAEKVAKVQFRSSHRL